jgi:hypothetical protein
MGKPMDVAKSKSSDATIEMLEGGIRALVRGNRPSDPVVSSAEDSLAAGATSIADIENLMEELQVAHDYLQSEGERVRQANARYAHLAHTASASVKIIAESLGKWRRLETSGQAPAALPRAPSLSPVHDGEPQHESDDQ